MTKEQQKDKIIEIVKKAIDDNSVTAYGEDDIVSIDGDDVDHIAEEVAENVIANKEIEELQNQAVRDFVQKLKEKCAYSFLFGQKFITEKVIDKLLEEYEK